MSQLNVILEEITQVMDRLDESQIDKAMTSIRQAKRIFILGEGRSGLQGKGFAMRLMHLGYMVYVIGESTTPSVQVGDLLVAISGSGTTGVTVNLAKKAKAAGVYVLGVSSEPNSPLVELSDMALIVPGATKTGSGVESIQLLSTLFDQSLHIALDYLCLRLSQAEGISQVAAHAQHSNME